MALKRVVPDRVLAFLVERKSAIVALLAFIVVGIFYFHYSQRFAGDIMSPGSRNYYPYLLDAFLHGRTNIANYSVYDLSLFQGKLYLYYGPAPLLLIFPFYLIWGVQASDVLFTLLAGFANVVLFYFVLRECKKHLNLSLSALAEFFLVLSFGLASPNFFLSLTGGIWFTCQIFATTYLLLFYLFYFKFLNNEKPYCLVLAMLFFCLTVFTRLSLIFHAVMFLYLLLYMRSHGRKISLKTLAVVGLVALVFLGFEGGYNAIRFGNPLETGLRYHHGAVRYAEIVSQNKLFSLSFIPHNVYYYFMHGVDIVFAHRPVIVSSEGNSVFSVYPALLLLPVFFFFKERLDRKAWAFVAFVGITALLSIFFLMCFFATGWMQFGSRYILDVLPLVFLALVLIMRYVPRSVLLVLLA